MPISPIVIGIIANCFFPLRRARCACRQLGFSFCATYAKTQGNYRQGQFCCSHFCEHFLGLVVSENKLFCKGAEAMSISCIDLGMRSQLLLPLSSLCLYRLGNSTLVQTFGRPAQLLHRTRPLIRCVPILLRSSRKCFLPQPSGIKKRVKQQRC